MSVTDPPLGPLPNIVKARALYTNYNTFSKEKYMNMCQRMYQMNHMMLPGPNHYMAEDDGSIPTSSFTHY